MENNTLSVRMYGEPIGILEQTAGKLSFHYLKPFPENQIRISHSLPLSMNEHMFLENECKPFFDGLLPDSEAAREAISKKHGFSSRNTFKLLEAIGKECAGAISFHNVDELIISHHPKERIAEYKTDEEIEILIKKLPTYPLLNGIDEIRLSLAGVQDKTCVVVDPLNPTEAPIGIPKNDSPSTHILKPEIINFPNSAYNEHFCLSLASAIGLEAAKTSFRKIGAIPCIIIERYDRKGTTRLHQEDFCQALGKLPAQKYQNEGGPSLKDCFDLLNDISPYLIQDRLRLIDYVFFNFIVGNTDAHSKNYSIIYDHDAHIPPRLAPLYDVLCCQIYKEHSRKMAMKIDDKYIANEVYARHWERFCQLIGISFPEFKERTQSICKDIPMFMNTIISSHEKHKEFQEYIPFAKELQSTIQNNIDTFLKRITL